MNTKFTIKMRDNPDSMEYCEAPFSATYKWRYPSKSIIRDLESNRVSLEEILQAMAKGTPVYRKEMMEDDYFIITIITPVSNTGLWRVAVGDSPNGRSIDYWDIDYLIKKVA